MTIFEEIRAYLSKTGISAAEMGRAMSKGGGFITKLLNEQMAMTPSRQNAIRQWMFDNPHHRPDLTPAYSRCRSGSGVDVAGNPDLWMKDAEIASAMLRDALHRYHLGGRPA